MIVFDCGQCVPPVSDIAALVDGSVLLSTVQQILRPLNATQLVAAHRLVEALAKWSLPGFESAFN